MKDRWDRIGWENMFWRYIREFQDGCATMRNQLRGNGYYTTDQVIEYYRQHGYRMVWEKHGRKGEEK